METISETYSKEPTCKNTQQFVLNMQKESPYLLQTHSLGILLHANNPHRPMQPRLLARPQQPPIRRILIPMLLHLSHAVPGPHHPLARQPTQHLVLLLRRRRRPPHRRAIRAPPAIPGLPMDALIRRLRGRQRLPLGPAARLVRLDPGLLATRRDEARARPARLLLDGADARDEPLALGEVAVLDPREEERHGALGEGGAERRVDPRRDRVRDDAGRDAAHGDGVVRGLGRRDALGEHGGGRHGRVAAGQDDLRHVVDEPHAGDVEGAVAERGAERGRHGELLFGGEGLEEGPEMRGKGGDGRLDARPLCESCGGGGGDVVCGATRAFGG